MADDTNIMDDNRRSSRSRPNIQFQAGTINGTPERVAQGVDTTATAPTPADLTRPPDPPNVNTDGFTEVRPGDNHSSPVQPPPPSTGGTIVAPREHSYFSLLHQSDSSSNTDTTSATSRVGNVHTEVADGAVVGGNVDYVDDTGRRDLRDPQGGVGGISGVGGDGVTAGTDILQTPTRPARPPQDILSPGTREVAARELEAQMARQHDVPLTVNYEGDTPARGDNDAREESKSIEGDSYHGGVCSRDTLVGLDGNPLADPRPWIHHDSISLENEVNNIWNMQHDPTVNDLRNFMEGSAVRLDRFNSAASHLNVATSRIAHAAGSLENIFDAERRRRDELDRARDEREAAREHEHQEHLRMIQEATKAAQEATKAALDATSTLTKRVSDALADVPTTTHVQSHIETAVTNTFGTPTFTHRIQESVSAALNTPSFGTRLAQQVDSSVDRAFATDAFAQRLERLDSGKKARHEDTSQGSTGFRFGHVDPRMKPRFGSQDVRQQDAQQRSAFRDPEPEGHVTDNPSDEEHDNFIPPGQTREPPADTDAATATAAAAASFASPSRTHTSGASTTSETTASAHGAATTASAHGAANDTPAHEAADDTPAPPRTPSFAPSTSFNPYESSAQSYHRRTYNRTYHRAPLLSDALVGEMTSGLSSLVRNWHSGVAGSLEEGCDLLDDAILRSLGVPSSPVELCVNMIQQHARMLDSFPDEHHAMKFTHWPMLEDLEMDTFVEFYRKFSATCARFNIAVTPFRAINSACEEHGLCLPGLGFRRYLEHGNAIFPVLERILPTNKPAVAAQVEMVSSSSRNGFELLCWDIERIGCWLRIIVPNIEFESI